MENSWSIDFKEYYRRLNSALLYHEAGKVTKSLGLIYEAHLPGASVGSLCKIQTSSSMLDMDEGVEAEVIGFKDKKILLMPFQNNISVNNDSRVSLIQKDTSVLVGEAMLGRVLDGRGKPIDRKGELDFSIGLSESRSLHGKGTDPVSRRVISEPLDVGIRALNGLLTCGKGQRVGIMAGSGVGKSVMLGMAARHTSADINVIALVGERGREVREFIERDLGEEGLKKSVVVVASSDCSPLERVRAAYLSATIAEFFRAQEKDVLLMMDSVTRFCMAQREIGLSLGEPPASKGYTPSVFSELPKLLERAGNQEGPGSITGLYTVLVEGDDLDDPIADAARSILDGHVVLSRRIAEKNHFPAIDVLSSTSRVMPSVVDSIHSGCAAQIREWIALYNQVEDLINIGAYVKGANVEIDIAVELNPRIREFLRQDFNSSSSYEDALAQMKAIFQAGQAMRSAAQTESQ